MSPEQARGTEADERTDLYAVGVILYHMVTGRKPFVADSPLAVLRMHMDDAPTPPTQLAPRCCSPELERVILRAMAKEPGARWQTAGEFAQALAATPEGREAAGTSGGGAGRRSGRRRDRGRAAPGGGRGIVGIAVRAAAGGGGDGGGGDDLDAPVAAVAAEGEAADRRRRQAGEGRVRVGEGGRQGDRPRSRRQKQGRGAGVAKKPEPTPPVTTPIVTKQEAPPPTRDAGEAGAADLGAATRRRRDDDDDDDDTVEEPAPPKDTPGAKLEKRLQAARAAETATPAEGSRAHAVPSTTRGARQLAAGKFDAAIQTLYAVRRTAHGSAEVALLLGHAYFKKLWRTDGLREYDNAIKLMPSLRWNALLVRDTVGALEGPTYRLARAVIMARIGTAALSEVRRVARTAKSPRTRARATRLAQQLAHGHRR